MGRKGPTRRGYASCQYVGAAAIVNSVIIRRVPGSLRKGDDPWHDPFRHLGWNAGLSPIVEHPDHIFFLDSPGLGIAGVDGDRLDLQLAEPRQIIKLAVSTPLKMRTDQLQRVFIGQGIIQAFPGLNVPGNSRYLGVVHLFRDP